MVQLAGRIGTPALRVDDRNTSLGSPRSSPRHRRGQGPAATPPRQELGGEAPGGGDLPVDVGGHGRAAGEIARAIDREEAEAHAEAAAPLEVVEEGPVVVALERQALGDGLMTDGQVAHQGGGPLHVVVRVAVLGDHHGQRRVALVELAELVEEDLLEVVEYLFLLVGLVVGVLLALVVVDAGQP